METLTGFLGYLVFNALDIFQGAFIYLGIIMVGLLIISVILLMYHRWVAGIENTRTTHMGPTTTTQLIDEITRTEDTRSNKMAALTFKKKMVTVTDHAESVVDVGRIKDDGLWVDDMTSTGDGHIVITGCAQGESFIVVTNRKGEVLRQDMIAKQNKRRSPWRSCDSFSQHRIGTMCTSGQIGIYDVRDGSHIKKNFSGCSSGAIVSRIATDPVKNRIYLGSIGREDYDISRDVFVLDGNLNYRFTLSLPNAIRGTMHMAVHNGILLVCDADYGGAYAVTLEGPESTVLYVFEEPFNDGSYWYPFRVCGDSNNFIYMLWRDYLDESRVVLTQYSPDGSQLLTTIPVDADAQAICTTMTDEGEKLMITTSRTGKMFIFGLVS